MDSEVTQVHTNQVPHDDELSLLKVASLVVRRRRLIFVWTLVGALLGVGVALISSPKYSTTSSFLPNEGDEAGLAGLAGMAGLAQQFGFAIPRSNNAAKSPEFYRDLLRSKEILAGVIRGGVDVVTATGVTNVDLGEHFEVRGKTLEERNTRTRRYLFKNVITVSVERETGVVTFNVRTDDPGLSSAIGLRLLDLISAFDLETRQSQAAAERGFAEERLEQMRMEFSIAEDSLKAFLIENRQVANSPQLTFENDRLERQVFMRQELVTSMAQDYEQARVDEVRNTPLITVIDKPEPAALPDPRWLLDIVLGLTLGMIVGFGLAFLRQFGEHAKSEGSEAYGEFQQVVKDAKWDLFGLRRSRRPAPSSADFDV